MATRLVTLYEVEIFELEEFHEFKEKKVKKLIRDFSKLKSKEYLISGKTEDGEVVQDEVRFLRDIILSVNSNVAYSICQISKKELDKKTKYKVLSVVSEKGDVNVKFDRVDNVKILTRLLSYPLNYSITVFDPIKNSPTIIYLYNGDKLFSYNFLGGKVLLNFERRDSMVIDVEGWEI